MYTLPLLLEMAAILNVSHFVLKHNKGRMLQYILKMDLKLYFKISLIELGEIVFM